MMVQTQKLSYGEHDEEIAFLNAIVKQYGEHHNADFKPLIDSILARIDHLTTTQNARLELYDQRVNG
jgi:hypothetical protein